MKVLIDKGHRAENSRQAFSGEEGMEIEQNIIKKHSTKMQMKSVSFGYLCTYKSIKKKSHGFH